MREVTIKLYKFEELSDKAKQNAIKHYRESMDWSAESQTITEIFTEKLSDMGYTIDNLEWSLNYSQGDGVAFYGYVDMDKLMEKLKKDGYKLNYELYDKMVKEGFTFTAKIYKNSFGNYYNHYNTMEVDIVGVDISDTDDTKSITNYLYDLNEESDEYKEKYNEVYTFFKEIRSAIDTDMRKTSKQLEQMGYELIEYYSSDEVIAENIIANDWEFTEDGNIYN